MAGDNQDDVARGKLLAVLSYVGILSIVPKSSVATFIFLSSINPLKTEFPSLGSRSCGLDSP